jgi:hypothetical protein
MVRVKQPSLLRLGFLITFLMSILATYRFTVQALNLEVLFRSIKWTAATGVGIAGSILFLVLLVGSWTSWEIKITRGFNQLSQTFAKFNWLNLFYFILVIAGYSYLIIGPLGKYFLDIQLRLPLFWIVTLLGAFFLKAFIASSVDQSKPWGVTGWLGAMAVAWVVGGIGYKIATFIPSVSTYPFSLGWSEASRYYYASLFFSQKIYGQVVPPSPLHPSRYLLQAIPFIIADLPLWVHRLWQVLLWVGVTYLTVYLLAKRFRYPEGWTWIARLAFISWGFLFLFQGPVYYHLLICAVIVLWGFDSQRFWKSLSVVLLASAWAGISRVNWYPVPGMIAASLYFFEERVGGSEISGVDSRRPISWRVLIQYLLPAISWIALGTVMAFASQAVYIHLSGIQVEAFTSSFSSDLLWYRLWPNSTFPLGILPAILIVSLPIFAILIQGLKKMHWIRKLGLLTILFILFVGGLVVSTKIGGGSNLHNLDAFLVLLMVAGSYVLFGQVRLYTIIKSDGTINVSRAMFALGMLVPVIFAIYSGSPQILPDRVEAQRVLAALNKMADETVDQGGEVLFISQRHLLTFGLIPNVPLVGNYEKVFLMEMAMAGDTTYLNNFYDDISEQRYAMIVSDREHQIFKGSDEMFGEENDVWVSRVTQPLLTYYQEAESFKPFGIEVLVPK